MKDFLGNEMQEHDIVVFAYGSRSAHGFKAGTITGFTPKMVVIDNGYYRKDPSKVVSMTAIREREG